MYIHKAKLKRRTYKPLVDKDGNWVTGDSRGGEWALKRLDAKYGEEHVLKKMTIVPSNGSRVYDTITKKNYYVSGNGLNNLVAAISTGMATPGKEDLSVDVLAVQVKVGTAYMIDFVSEVEGDS